MLGFVRFLEVDMLKVELQSWECPICFNQFEEPWIHNGCGQTMDRQCIVDVVQKLGRCPGCNIEATMKQFKPNVAVRDAMEELQRTIPATVAEKKVEEPAPPLPIPSFSPSVSSGDKKSFSHVMNDVKKRDISLYNSHVKKDSTRKLRVDWGNGYVAVFKSNSWHFYKVGNGAGPELCKNKAFDQGVRFIFPERC